MRKIPSAGPSITNLEINNVSKAIKIGWGNKMNYYIDEFKQSFSKFTGLKYVLPTAHCTDAIHLAMKSLDIGPGDEVIVPDLTWVASAAPVVYVGAKPVFADVDPNSWCITPKSIENCITSKTKAVVVVDLLGNMPEWDEIIKLCKKKKIFIIEDASEAVGAKYKGKPSGNFGVIGVFSFNATKLIMSGQGGAFCTNSKKLYEKAKLLSHHGMNNEKSKKHYWSEAIGHNYNWTNIQAALALAQLKRIKKLIKYKKELYNSYRYYLKSEKKVRLNSYSKNVSSDYWITVAIINKSLKLNKEKICKKFKKYKIDVRPMFYPLSSMKPFKEYIKRKNISKKNPVSYELSKYGICLPNGNNLKKSEVKYITQCLKKVLT